MIGKSLKKFVENTLGCRIYRGWFPRGTNLTFDLERLLPDASPLIVDVGANVGQTAVELASKYPNSSIHACEPIAGTFDMLVRNTGQHRHILCHQIALGDKTTEGEMHLYEGTVNNSLKPAEQENSIGIERVPVQSLDDFCIQQAIGVIDYLKIDTEGFDLQVVLGGARIFEEKRVRVLLAELGFSKTNAKHVPFTEFLTAMHERHMSLFGVYDQRREFDGTEALRRADCLFISDGHTFPGLANSPDN